ncbi:MAG: hypothetical protein J07AB43_11640, partial [Candidatus Nanosalina sp. J07AB43]
MKPNLIYATVFLAVLASGCTSTGVSESSLDTKNIPEEELVTYSIDTGEASPSEVKNALKSRLSTSDIAHKLEVTENNSSEKSELMINVRKGEGERVKKLLTPKSEGFKALLRFDASNVGKISYGNSSSGETFNVVQRGE